MSYSYDTKRRHTMPESRSEIPDSVQQSFNAIQNVDIHSGRKLDLESSLKSRIEQNTGFRMDNVELRESSDAAAMDAKAFAKGNVVHFAPGQFDQHSAAGQHLIEHELTHVAQQARGGVRADVDGLNVNASEHFESQADSGMSFSGGALQALPTMNAEAAPIQGAFGGIKKFFKKIFGKGNDEQEAPAPVPEAPQPDEINSLHDEIIDAEVAKERGNGASERTIREMRRNYGYGLKTRDYLDFTDTAKANHEAEVNEMVEYMKQSGFSDEEIEAQIAFQNCNKSFDMLHKYNGKKMDLNFSKFGEIGAYGDSTKEGAFNDIKYQMLGMGVNSQEERRALAGKEDSFFDYLESLDDEEKADRLAKKLGRR